jgi:Na+-driven multidrug efflux pump
MHIYGGALRGTGDLKGFLATFCGNMFSRAAFSYMIFPFIGKFGIWISVAMGWFIGATIGYVIFKIGKWQGKCLI